MKIQDIVIGMKVIPIGGRDFDTIKQYPYMMPKGYLVVCDISSVLVYCYKNRIHTAWGREMYYIRGRWMAFKPEELIPVTKNSGWFLKKKSRRR
jgi:hypothetical protein